MLFLFLYCFICLFACLSMIDIRGDDGDERDEDIVPQGTPTHDKKGEEEEEEEEEIETEDEDEEKKEDGTVAPVCASTHLSEDHGDLQVVFVHGLKGSKLVDRTTRKVIWVKAVRALRHAPELCCGPDVCGVTFPDEKYHEIDAVGPLTKVLGGVMKIYGPFVKACKKKWGDNFQSFSYDWRRDIVDVSQDLGRFLSQLCTKKDPSRLLLVVHSMGGLVTWAMLSLLAKKIASSGKESLEPWEKSLFDLLRRTRVLFCSTPFNPISAIIEDFTWGTRMHSSILPAKKVFTFPTAYQLLLGPRSDPHFAPFYNPDAWLQLRLGPFADKSIGPEMAKECVRALPRMFDYANNLRTKVLLPDFTGTPFEGLLTAVVAGKALKTPARIPDDFFNFNEERGGNWAEDRWAGIKCEEGDGRVPYSFATSVPKGLNVTKVHLTNSEHTHTLNDHPVISRAIDELLAL